MRIEELGQMKLVVDIHSNREVWDELFSHLGTRPSGTSVFSLLQCGEYSQDSTVTWFVGDALHDALGIDPLNHDGSYISVDADTVEQMRAGTYQFRDRVGDYGYQFFLGCDILVEKERLHVGDHKQVDFHIWW